MATTATKTRLHQSRIDLPESQRMQVIELLNRGMAMTLDLYTQVKQAHWNVRGKDFFQLHEMFDLFATELLPFVDEQAERVTALAGTPMGTIRMASQATELPDYPADLSDGMEHVAALADRYAIFARVLRESIDKADEAGDKDTADLFTAISRAADMRLWFLEAHLTK